MISLNTKYQRFVMWLCEHVFGFTGSPSLRSLGLHTTLKWVWSGSSLDAA